MKNNIEIMAPVGSYEALSAAIQAGAGSVYFGIGKLNMRSRSAKNFTLDDLRQLAETCNENGVKSYVTVNTIIYDEEMEEMHQLLDAIKANGISAIIASDQSVIQYARQIGVEVHMSTQCNITNLEAVKYYSQFADVMVTARELNIDQVKHITEEIERQQIRGPHGNLVRIEVFCHGALCMAISGKCNLSQDIYNSSSNRGACMQLCRRGYDVREREEGYELALDNEYIMSPKDLCTLPFLDRVLDAGDDIFAFGGNWGQDNVEQLATGKVTLWFKDGDETKWNDQTLTYTDGDNSVKISGVALENINLKFGDDNGNAIERKAELSAAGAFDEFTNGKIFEDKNRGMLA